MRKFYVAALAATVTALLAPAAAQAAPTGTTALLGTYDFGHAAIIGEAGVAAGVWRSTTVRTRFAGDDLTVTFAPRTKPRTSEKLVYTAVFNEVADAQTECREVGADGVAHHVWVSFRCQTGFVPSYTLYVR
ncbi:hypothetical protein BJY16_006373 [Actinoplanes octamycinicus]|uniref:Uncharacterized protein n=1 Tax=Actinoplanes octamycinicus TaxID=135948 RepID=A0A7W7H2R3_9ACTN|nr:hypothetical protein [Actinoplanes octamycinicus]MBB4742914.1 hypothetical protein [Actinoplanes octamycinicus]GIE58233.1 hypothetical protein Aoc01nite_36350 [Actinoplanes octamycinicus]